MFSTKKEYNEYFLEEIRSLPREKDMLEDYLEKQLERLNQLIDEISKETFWKVFPKILGIDAKLSLLADLSKYEDFSEADIIRIIESDYQNYFKELCGYDLSMQTKYSMVFNVCWKIVIYRKSIGIKMDRVIEVI